ncbi:MAG: hypothetical protein U0521_16570 [Anaerolineae bacterium]
MTFDHSTLAILAEALDHLEAGFDDLPPFEPELDHDALRAVLLETADRLRDNYPYQHPFYAGQMLKPGHPVARLAYALAQYLNPNNHALDGSRASSPMEKEAVAHIAAMFGWQTHLDHPDRQRHDGDRSAMGRRNAAPRQKIVASSQAHYTHNRISKSSACASNRSRSIAAPHGRGRARKPRCGRAMSARSS